MLVESVVTSVAVGKARGGKIKNIGNVNFRGWYLFIIGFIIEFAAVYINAKKIVNLSDIVSTYFVFIHGFSYILIFIGLILNFNKKSMMLIFIGALLNFMVIMANGGMMPVSGQELQDLGLFEELNNLSSEVRITHTLLDDSTKLPILGDIISTPRFYPLSKIFSIGDIFISIGVFLFIQGAMLTNSRFNRKTNMISFEYRVRKKIM